MCGDFRALNDHTIADIYAMPHIDGILHNLKGAARVAVLDAFKGYYIISFENPKELQII